MWIITGRLECARCICLLLILELLHSSMGSASFALRAEYHVETKLVEDKSSSDGRDICTTNCPPVLQIHNNGGPEESQTLRAPLLPGVVARRVATKNFLQRRYIGTNGRQFRNGLEENVISRQTQLEENENSSPRENVGKLSSSHDDDTDYDAPAHVVDVPKIGTSRKLLLRSMPVKKGTSFFWFLKRQERQQRLKDHELSQYRRDDDDTDQDDQAARRMTIDSAPDSSPSTQDFLLGPPAPSGLVHNEKQDWNQDYAEPDVHPPSSN